VAEGDCDEALAELPAASVDAVVCDSPYGIDFQGERWDGQAIREAAARRAEEPMSAGEVYQAWCRTWAGRCLEAVKPGAHLAAFGSPRTTHRLACALEEAGFELRDTLIWLYGTGLPKSRKLRGGRATSLKPAYEPILLARRPPEGALERNLKAHGTGAINAAACRLEGRYPATSFSRMRRTVDRRRVPLAAQPASSTPRPTAPASPPARCGRQAGLFYCPKAGRAERDAGCEDLPRRRLDLSPNAQAASYKPPPAANTHPTVKPLALMRWLVGLVVPPDGLLLDPFCGYRPTARPPTRRSASASTPSKPRATTSRPSTGGAASPGSPLCSAASSRRPGPPGGARGGHPLGRARDLGAAADRLGRCRQDPHGRRSRVAGSSSPRCAGCPCRCCLRTSGCLSTTACTRP
jgi:DNA modification methylase